MRRRGRTPPATERGSQPYPLLPFQRDVGGSFSLDGGVWGGETPEGTQEVGGPASASRNEPQRGLWFVFASPSLILPPH